MGGVGRHIMDTVITTQYFAHVGLQLLEAGGVILALVLANLYVKSRATR
jgi:hypothetical protein